MVHDVSDSRSNPQEQIAHAARVLGRSKHRKLVFKVIYTGKMSVKTVEYISNVTKLSQKRVLEEGAKLVGNKIVENVKVNKKTAYKKDLFYTQNRDKILALTRKGALDKFPTKSNPRITYSIVNVPIPKKAFDIKQLTIDDIDSFSKVRKEKRNKKINQISEKWFKEGIKGILRETGQFHDWGGESGDLFSTRLILQSKRVNVTFGFKGKGTKGSLTPKKMGKRGDQIQNLFRTPADVYIIQYWNQIEESILTQLKTFALVKSISEQKRIYYGIIDGQDTQRLIAAYPTYFK